MYNLRGGLVTLRQLLFPFCSIVLITCFCFKLIFHYYAPYGRCVILQWPPYPGQSEVISAIPLDQTSKVIQPFFAPYNGLAKIKIQVVTWQKKIKQGSLKWSLLEENTDEKKEVATGQFLLNTLDDWQFIELSFNPLLNSACKNYLLEFYTIKSDRSENALNSVGFPLMKLKQENTLIDSDIEKFSWDIGIGIPKLYVDNTPSKNENNLHIPVNFFYFTDF